MKKMVLVNKRGVSDVITTVLIILLVLAAVAIIGGILLKNIGDAGSKIGTQTACIDLDVKPVTCARTGSAATATVSVNRGGRSNNIVVNDITLLFRDTSANTVVTVLGSAATGSPVFAAKYNSDDLKALETDSYVINLLSTSVAKYAVKTAVTIKGENGQPTVCEPSTVEVDCK